MTTLLHICFRDGRGSRVVRGRKSVQLRVIPSIARGQRNWGGWIESWGEKERTKGRCVANKDGSGGVRLCLPASSVARKGKAKTFRSQPGGRESQAQLRPRVLSDAAAHKSKVIINFFIIRHLALAGVQDAGDPLLIGVD